jgi:hypothetical protein
MKYFCPRCGTRVRGSTVRMARRPAGKKPAAARAR